MIIPEISVLDLKAKFDKKEKFVLLDVREPHEYEIAKIPGSTLIPLGALPARFGEARQERQAHRTLQAGWALGSGRQAPARERLRRGQCRGRNRRLVGVDRFRGRPVLGEVPELPEVETVRRVLQERYAVGPSLPSPSASPRSTATPPLTVIKNTDRRRHHRVQAPRQIPDRRHRESRRGDLSPRHVQPHHRRRRKPARPLPDAHRLRGRALP